MRPPIARALGAVTLGAAAYLMWGATPAPAPAPETPAPTISAPATPAPATLPAELGARPRARESTLALARFAIAAQTITPPAEFSAGLAWSAPYAHDYWRGRVWICDPSDVFGGPVGRDDLSANDLADLRDYGAFLVAHPAAMNAPELCYAVVDDAHGRAETGP